MRRREAHSRGAHAGGSVGIVTTVDTQDDEHCHDDDGGEGQFRDGERDDCPVQL